jgi:hypothetical protein
MAPYERTQEREQLAERFFVEKIERKIWREQIKKTSTSNSLGLNY